LDDLLLPSVGNTDSVQIDHVVVSNYGIFVIETKTYKGWIFGDAHKRYWTQVIYSCKTKLYNPLWQNYSHIKAIELLVRPLFPKTPILGFVVFPAAGKLAISGTDQVGILQEVLGKIQNYTAEVVSDAERDEIVKLLVGANIQDKKLRKLHVLQTREIQSTAPA
jgi:hypothetical protein